MNLTKLAYLSSPFIPNNEKDLILQAATNYLERGFDISASLAMAILPIMEAHTSSISHGILTKHGLTPKDLHTLTIGFKLPLESIMVSSILQNLDPTNFQETYEAAVNDSFDALTLLSQEVIQENLVSIVNLFKINPRGELIFEHLKKYSTITNHIFKEGSEIAAIVYFNLAPDIAKLANDNDWLTAPPFVPDNLS